MSILSDCRLQKRASASISLRLPRGRPPAVGVDSSFFNLTPPSVETSTPTADRRILDKPILDQSLSDQTSNDGKFVMATPPDINPEPHS